MTSPYRFCQDRLTLSSTGHYFTCSLPEGHDGNHHHHDPLAERDIYWTPVEPVLTPWEAIVAEAEQVLALGNDEQYLGGQTLAEMVINYKAESNG
jgi:hypothetical protein